MQKKLYYLKNSGVVKTSPKTSTINLKLECINIPYYLEKDFNKFVKTFHNGKNLFYQNEIKDFCDKHELDI